MSARAWSAIPPLEIVARRRPIDLVVPSTARTGEGSLDALAPYCVATMTLEPGRHPDEAIHFRAADGTVITGWWREGRAGLTVRRPTGHTTDHVSRRHSRPKQPPIRLALTLTGVHATVLTQGPGDGWTARGRVGLSVADFAIDTRNEAWLATLHASGSRELTRGDFGQLGLRDLRLVSHADGTAYHCEEDPEWLWLSATHAGPGFFDTAHTGIWRLHPSTLELQHTSSLWFRRPDKPGVYGDHSVHVVRDGAQWLVATSTWGDFHREEPRVGITLARTEADLLRGRHRLDTTALPMPTEGLNSRGVWDPHLLRDERGWHVGFVSARKFFVFHPALASGPTLDQLTLRSAASRRKACEGITLVKGLNPSGAPGSSDGRLTLLASDGRDGRRGERARFVVFDEEFRDLGALTAPYPTNIPWPTLVQLQAGDSGRRGDWLMISFNGTPTAGRLTGYGTHGDVVVMREARPESPEGEV